MKRRVLVIIVGSTIEQPQWMLAPKAMGVVEVLTLMLTNPDLRGAAGPGLGQADEYLLFDWSGRRLRRDARIGEVPLPGVVVALHPQNPMTGFDGTAVLVFRQALMGAERSRDILFRFLASPDAAAVPDSVKTIDVFVSYSFEDSSLAAAIVRDLGARGSEVFLAEASLGTGRPWREQLHGAVRSSRAAVLLITPASAHSTWVLAEAGAFASLGTPMVVLYDGVAPASLPTPLLNASAMEPANEPERWLRLLDRRPAVHTAGV